MRRPVLALALLVGCVAATTHSASTASSTVPASTAGYRTTTVSGASMTALEYTVSAETITGLRVRLRGNLLTLSLLPKPVTARFGTGPTVTCTPGVITVVSGLVGVRQGTWTCTGLAESASRPRPLHVQVG